MVPKMYQSIKIQTPKCPDTHFAALQLKSRIRRYCQYIHTPTLFCVQFSNYNMGRNDFQSIGRQLWYLIQNSFLWTQSRFVQISAMLCLQLDYA